MKQLLLFGIMCSVFFSCIPSRQYVYTPSTTNLLETEKKNDVVVAANVSVASDFFIFQGLSGGLDLQSAYAISDKLVFKADYYTKGESSTENETNNNGDVSRGFHYSKKGSEFNFGVKDLMIGKNTSIGIFGGYGLGKFKINRNFEDTANNVVTESNYHYSNYNKFTFQPYIAFSSNKKTVTAILSIKYSLLDFKNIKTNFSLQDMHFYSFENLQNSNSTFADFILHLKLKAKPDSQLYGQMQFGYTSKTAIGNHSNYDYYPFWGSMGLVLDLSKFWKK